jgi:hypothetical protein
VCITSYTLALQDAKVSPRWGLSTCLLGVRRWGRGRGGWGMGGASLTPSTCASPATHSHCRTQR